MCLGEGGRVKIPSTKYQIPNYQIFSTRQSMGKCFYD